MVNYFVIAALMFGSFVMGHSMGYMERNAEIRNAICENLPAFCK